MKDYIQYTGTGIDLDKNGKPIPFVSITQNYSGEDVAMSYVIGAVTWVWIVLILIRFW